jgi:hypothetical protein
MKIIKKCGPDKNFKVLDFNYHQVNYNKFVAFSFRINLLTLGSSSRLGLN